MKWIWIPRHKIRPMCSNSREKQIKIYKYMWGSGKWVCAQNSWPITNNTFYPQTPLCRPLNRRERCIHSTEIIEVISPKEVVARHTLESKLTKKFTFDRTFGPDSKQVDVYAAVVGPLIEEVLSGYNCTVFAYGQTGTGKTHTMVGNECAELKSSWEDVSTVDHR